MLVPDDFCERTWLRGMKLPNAGELKPYPEMKDSGVEWLGEVPTHWEVRRIKNWVTVNKRVLSEDTDPSYMFDYLDIGPVGTGQLTAKPGQDSVRKLAIKARRIVRLARYNRLDGENVFESGVAC